MESEFGEHESLMQSLEGDENLPVLNEYYFDSEYDPDEPVNSGGIEVRTDKKGGRYYKVKASIDSDSLALLRVIIKYPSKESFNQQDLEYVLPDLMVSPNGIASFRIAQDSKLMLTPKGVIIKDEDIQEESLIRKNFTSGRNLHPCKLPGISHYQYQVDSLIKDHAVFEWEGEKYGAHIYSGIKLWFLSPAAIIGDFELLRRNKLFQDQRARQMADPYFGIRLFKLTEEQKA